jgi:hypothetical protein
MSVYRGRSTMEKILTLKPQNLPFISVENLLKLVSKIGIEKFLIGLAESIQQDFARWNGFEKSPRFTTHSPQGVIEDFSALRYLQSIMQQDSDYLLLDLLANPSDSRNLFGLFCGSSTSILSEAG